MKNKKSIKVIGKILEPIFYFFFSIVLSILVLSITKDILNFLYSYFDYTSIISKVINVFMDIKMIIGDFIYVIIFVIMTFVFYIGMMYKRTSTLVSVVDETRQMAKGDLDKVIEVKSDDEIGELGENINTIVSRLRNITEEERKAQQTKTDLITNVSHDLRTPLTSMIGYLGLIEEDKYKDEVELRYYINIAYEKAQNLNILINDLFELTKMQNKTIPLKKMDIDLIELIGQIISHFKYELTHTELECRMNFTKEKLEVNVDPEKLVRCFENLISNAMSYGSEGKYIDIVVKKKNQNALIQFINYGESIPQVDLPYIFDRFYRVEKSRNKRSGGSGLGLSICKNIIELHNGKIKATSDSERTIFEIEIPLKNKC